jgi:hypothetical protein
MSSFWGKKSFPLPLMLRPIPFYPFFSLSDRIAAYFSGVEVKPGKPYTLTHSDSLGRLRLTQVHPILDCSCVYYFDAINPC